MLTLQPNPDDIYLHAPISPQYRYRVSGSRGTAKMLAFNTMAALVDIDADGKLEILLSAERPDGHKGNWLPIKPGAVARMRSNF